MSNIQTAYDQVRKFNLIAGNFEYKDKVAALASVKNQLKFIKEELKETSDGFDAKDINAVVDGACDLFVTISGLMQKLEVQGVNIEKALARVNENNISKFPKKAVDGNCPTGAYLINTPYGHVVYKRTSDGKIMKPNDYVDVNLVGTYPEDYFGPTVKVV